MWKTNKLIKRYFYAIILLFCTGGLINYLLRSEPREYLDNKYKLNIIENRLNSYENVHECKIPNLPIDNPEIMQFYKETDPINCGYDNWIECNGSLCSVKDNIKNENGNVVCEYTDIMREDDFSSTINYADTKKTADIYKLINSDFSIVQCKAQNGHRWNGLAIGIRENVKRKLEYSKNYNVLMFGFDSLSHNAFKRKLPKTYDYLTKILNASVLKGYNIVGDGTPQALIPILTGYTELELPETRKRVSGSKFVNSYPMIWKFYEKFGYVTAFNEDLPDAGTFTYRLNGFNEQPTDHYMRQFYIDSNNYFKSSNKFCIGGDPSHQIMMNYTKNFMLHYNETPRFVFSFHGELSHDSINDIGAADDDILKWLKELKEKKLLENTILIMMSDHGNRFADVRNTLQGKLEERLPFFSFTFPDSFKKRYPKAYEIFLINTNRLTTPFDIHETLIDLMHLQNLINKQKTTSRAISLFDEIPKNRSCSKAYIEPHWCSCLNWQFINDTNSIFIDNLANSVVNVINQYTLMERNICEHLKLSKINWIMKLQPQKDLIKFKKNIDFDGFLADLSSDMKISYNIYQIKITLLPGLSIFEASVTHNLYDNKFDVQLSQISRINKYGSQANCIYKKNPELRKYCYCKN